MGMSHLGNWQRVILRSFARPFRVNLPEAILDEDDYLTKLKGRCQAGCLYRRNE